jgi:S1-C subfamily serine protease
MAGRVEGVEVVEVRRGSPAWYAGLRPEDILIAVNRVSIATVDDVMNAVKRDPHELLLNIIRGNSQLMVEIQ